MDHDNWHHLCCNQSKGSNKSLCHSSKRHTQTLASCRGNHFSSSLKRILGYFLSFLFFRFFQSRTTSSSLAGSEFLHVGTMAPSSVSAKSERRQSYIRTEESFCVCRRERAIRSRQSFGHQPQRRDVTYIYINI